MAAEDERILRQVRYEVKELRKLGEDWGMTSMQINDCINEAFRKHVSIEITEKIAKKIQQGTKWSKIRFAFRLWLAFIIAVFGFAIMVTYTDSVSDAVGRALQPYGYPLMRIVRLASLPLHKYNISSYHNMECLIENPYFTEEEESECACRGIHKVRVSKLKKDKELGPQFYQKPILLKELQKELVPLDHVVKLVKEEYEILKDPSLKVHSSADWITTIGDLNDNELETKIYQEKDFHVIWDSRRIKTSQILRKLFPRPVVYEKKTEIVITKSLFIAGPSAQGDAINDGHDANDLFYIQGWGSRTIFFTPRNGCESECDVFEVTVQAGDVLMFPNIWRVEQDTNGDEISVAFLGGVA